jgi:hypothetical protein
MKKKATLQDLQRLLEDCNSLKSQLGIDEASFMIPVDGDGLRIHVSTTPGQCEPGRVDVEIGLDQEVKVVTFEFCDDFEPTRIQGGH